MKNQTYLNKVQLFMNKTGNIQKHFKFIYRSILYFSSYIWKLVGCMSCRNETYPIFFFEQNRIPYNARRANVIFLSHGHFFATRAIHVKWSINFCINPRLCFTLRFHLRKKCSLCHTFWLHPPQINTRHQMLQVIHLWQEQSLRRRGVHFNKSSISKRYRISNLSSR